MSTTDTEKQAQTAPAPGHAPTTADGIDPSQLPPDIERFDLSSPEYLEHAHERYEEMRAKCPVSRAIFTTNEGVEDQGFFNRPFWIVTDYEEGSRALLD
ncbi:MAG: hypothetical protein ACRDJC_06230, partial [Thermomicrobiales bacterium]